MAEMTLETAKQQQHVKVKGNLRKLLTEWKTEGGAGNYLSSEAIAEMFQNDTGIIIQGRTVDNYIDVSNTNAVPLPFLCWCAKKRGVSLDYLITGKDDAPKGSTSKEGATVSEVLDALRVILTAFPSQVELEKYEEKETTYIGGLLLNVPKTYYSIHINSAVIQELLANMWAVKDVLKNPQAKPHETMFTEGLFIEPLEKNKEQYDAVSNTGVFYKTEDKPAFVRLPDSSVSAAVPFLDMDIFSQKYVDRGYEEYYGQHEYEAIPNKLRKSRFDEDSYYTLKDVDEVFVEPEGIIIPEEDVLPF